MVVFGPKVVVFGQKWMYLDKVVQLDKYVCFWTEVVVNWDKVVVFGQVWLY